MRMAWRCKEFINDVYSGYVDTRDNITVNL